MNSLDPVEDRYRRDPLFRNFVDTVEALILNAKMSPSEIREGAMLACIHYEMRRLPTPMFLREENRDD